jgi:hypothetical protein
MALVTAGSAFAVASCQTSTSPINVSSEAGLKVGCLLDVSATATANTAQIQIHDALNAAWHRGAARTATVTTTVGTTITFAAGTIQAGDIRRPISGTGIGATAFIRSVAPTATCTTTCTSAVLSVASTAAASITATIEHTTARVVTDASYTLATPSVLTSVTGTFVAADLNKSVSGGGFPPGARISTFTSATSVKVTPGPNAAGTAKEITFGSVQYTAASPSTATTYTDANPRELARTTNTPAGSASCTGSTLTVTTAGGGTNAGDVLLPVQFFASTGAAVAGGPWTVSTHPTATTDLLSAPCPTGTPAWTNVSIGQPGANAPKNGTSMATLTASLNLNPALNATSDACNTNTYEGFSIGGDWNNAGSFTTTAVLGAPSDDSVAQILFPTSVVAFAAYVVPKASDTHQAGPHFDVILPSLPTSLAVCPIVAGTTTVHTEVIFGFQPTNLSVAPFLGTGSGNQGSPANRQIGPATGLFGEKVSLFNSTGGQIGADIAPTGCTFIARTATPTFGCGLG